MSSNSWRNLAAVQHPHALKPDLELTGMGMPSHGSVVLLEGLPHGALATTTATITRVVVAVAVAAPVVVAMVEEEAVAAALHLGPATDVSATMTATVATTIMAVRAMVTEGPPLLVQRLGRQHPERRRDTEAMAAVTLVVATLVALLWARPQVSVDHLELPAWEHPLPLPLIT